MKARCLALAALFVGAAHAAPRAKRSTTTAQIPHPETAVLLGKAPPPDTGPVWWYRTPALTWNSALPIGNGRIGGMIYGGVAHEDIQLNEDTIWAGYRRDNVDNPAALAALPQIRHLLFTDQDEEATALIGRTMMGRPPRILSYQPLGDLLLDFPGIAQAKDYRRELDLSDAIARVQFEANGATYRRELFASAPDQVIAIRLTASRPGALTFAARLARSQDASSRIDESDGARIRLVGQIMSQYIGSPRPVPSERFEGDALILPQGGQLERGGDGSLRVLGANSAVILIAAGTDYRGGDPAAMCRGTLERARVKGWDALRSAHIADYRRLFDRVEFRLGRAPDLPTDERLRQFSRGADDPQLFADYFQFGRYLLISSSRPGGMPANLQGLWNAEMQASWNSDYHTNINIQMNYWPAEVCNLAECHLPLFDLMDQLAGPGSRTARIEYGAGGWVVHHLTDPWLFTSPADGPQGVWPMGAAWLAQHPWEHYAFSGDTEFLRTRAYPLMKGAARFILDFLVVAPPGTAFPGRLVTAPSHSPENSFILPNGDKAELTYGATMDLEIIHDLLTHCIDATRILNTDAAFRAECERALARLAPLQISKKTGRLQEWIEDYQEADPHHRHASHLFAVFPGDQITLDGTPELAAAARKSLLARGNKGAQEWSYAWRAAIWARLRDAERAYGQVQRMLATDLYPNCFNRYPPFQIDGNFGATAAEAEMLLQSQGGVVRLLPALPAEWPSGSIHGLRARGGFVVGMDWSGGRLTSVTVHSTIGGPLVLVYGSERVTLITRPDGWYAWAPGRKPIVLGSGDPYAGPVNM